MPKSNESAKTSIPECTSFSGQNGGEKSPAVFYDAEIIQNEDTAQENASAFPQTFIPLEPQNVSATREVFHIFTSEFITKILVSLSRLLIGGLVIYDFLHAIGILHHSLNFTWTGLTFTSASVWFLLELILYHTKKNSGQIIFVSLMLATILGLYLDTIGDMHFLFDKISWYDQMLHFFAGGMTCAGILFWVIKNLEDHGKIKVRLIGVGFFSWMTAVFFGVLYELAEYSEDVFTGSHRLGDTFDTANDLLLDVAGSLFIVIILVIYFYYVSHRSRSSDKNPITESANS